MPAPDSTQPSQWGPSAQDWLRRFLAPASVAADGPGVVEPLSVRHLHVRTAGSTGIPQQVFLSPTAVRSSALLSTQARLASDWVLALPLTHIAGWNVVSRAVVRDCAVSAVDLAASFTPDSFVTAARALSQDRPFSTALVPTQLSRLLGDADAVAVLQRCDTVLVGGAACPPPLLERCRDLGIAVVRTYGMSETCGGCVYDGIPLPGVQVRERSDGGLSLAGPTLADGYGDQVLTDRRFAVDADGTRWFHSSDAGSVGTDGRVRVTGRLDDAITCGGTTIHPLVMETALAQITGVREACVVAVADAEWGQVPVAIVELDCATAKSADDVLAEAHAHRGAELHRLRKVVVVDALPRAAVGKIDRAAARSLLPPR